MLLDYYFYLWRSRLASRYSDYAKGCTARGSNPGKGKRVFSKKIPERPWDQLSLLFNWYRGPFQGAKQRGREVNLHVVPRLRTSRTIPLLPHYVFMAWRGTNFTVLLYAVSLGRTLVQILCTLNFIGYKQKHRYITKFLTLLPTKISHVIIRISTTYSHADLLNPSGNFTYHQV
jgi:hypothetical protein